jgi:hypothetical protein
MATLSHFNYFECTIGGELKTAGSLTTAASTFTVTEVHDQTVTVGDGNTAELFDIADDLPDFDYLWIESNQGGCLLQIVIDDGGENGESYQVISLSANTAIVLGDNVGLASDGAVDLFTGTTDAIERINFKNASGAPATVRTVAFT